MRFLNLLTAIALVAAAPVLADDWVMGTDAVVNVKLTSNADPIAAAFEPALRQSQALQAKHANASQWLINVDWPAAPTGVQFILRVSPRSFRELTPRAWIAQFRFNGGSEAGVIEAGRWCRREASRDYPEICKGVDAAVESRNVKRLVGR